MMCVVEGVRKNGNPLSSWALGGIDAHYSKGLTL
jgi:hypothetical protein